MTDFGVDRAGQIVGVGHHDGRLRSVVLRDGEIEIGLTSSAGQDAVVTLSGVKLFALNNLREGNIVDRMYLWRLEEAPGFIVRRMRDALGISYNNVLGDGVDGVMQIFHLECSYGAELFAIVEQLRAKAMP